MPLRAIGARFGPYSSLTPQRDRLLLCCRCAIALHASLIVAAASDQRFAPVQGGQRANAANAAWSAQALGISTIGACQ